MSTTALPASPAPVTPVTGASLDWLSAGRLDMLSRLQHHLIWVALLVLAAVGAVTWTIVDNSHRQLIEFKAITLAEVVARQAASARSAYAEHVATKLQRDGTGKASEAYLHEPGSVPLPAQFLKLVGQKASAESGGLYRYQPISKWNLGQGQQLRDDFQRWAWAQLEAQDQAAPGGPIAWRSPSRVELVNGERTLRFLRADAASSAGCVQCHNALEAQPAVQALRAAAGVQVGKQWRQHQLLGALEVQVPLAPVEALAAQQRREVLAAVMGLTLAGIVVLGLLVFTGTARARKLTEQLAWQAGHDRLTGLVNRPHFEHRLQALLSTAAGDGSTHALMFMDLDQFKLVNDSCGHAAGDQLLCQLGESLKGSLRSSDTLARLGGDEFGVLLAHCSLDQAATVAQKLLQATADFRFAWANRVFEVGVSIGLVEVKAGTGNSVASLMSAADMACYAAKEAGRHRVRIFSAGGDELARRREDLAWSERISQAMAHGRMALAVQTARALDPALPVQCYQELLLRMFDADGSQMPTGPLIAAAERHQLMSARIDRWVLQTACDYIRTGRLPADASHIVAVNLSAQSLCDDGFLAFACSVVKESGIDPRVLCLEITETAAIANLRQATGFMRALKALGCRFALDDFGSGLSSFGYLKNLEVDFLKLDGAFVRDITTDATDRAMVGAIAAVGRAMNIPTIAEWVENDAIRDEVQRQGIGYAQGYGIEKPRLV
jgi:diguanylate cyclase (GGDEF)-like protein